MIGNRLSGLNYGDQGMPKEVRFAGLISEKFDLNEKTGISHDLPFSSSSQKISQILS
jgi:hypothetical protein